MAIIQAPRYAEHELELSKLPAVIKLYEEFNKMGGDPLCITFEDMLQINQEADRRGIQAEHIGALKGAFQIIKKGEPDSPQVKELREKLKKAQR